MLYILFGLSNNKEKMKFGGMTSNGGDDGILQDEPLAHERGASHIARKLMLYASLMVQLF
jgi:hypothetical protein